MLNQSPHAHRRSAQRSVPIEHIQVALIWGREIRQPGGRIAYHLGRREARDALLRWGERIPERAIGVAVVVAGDGTIVTVVRSPNRSRLRVHGLPSRRARRSRGGR
jgi:hypothetical protein